MHKQYLESLGFSWWYNFDSLEVWTWKTNLPDDEYQEALYKIRKSQPNTFLPLYREEKTGIWHNNELTITVDPSQFNNIRDSRKMKDGGTTTFILTKTNEGIEAKSKQEGFTFVFFNEFDFDIVIEILKKENAKFVKSPTLKFEINDSRKMKDYFGRELFEDVYVLDEFIINGQKFYLLEGFYVKKDAIAYAITSDYNGESYWNGAGTITDNEQEARQMIQEMKGSIKDSRKVKDTFAYLYKTLDGFTINETTWYLLELVEKENKNIFFGIAKDGHGIIVEDYWVGQEFDTEQEARNEFEKIKNGTSFLLDSKKVKDYDNLINELLQYEDELYAKKERFVNLVKSNGDKDEIMSLMADLLAVRKHLDEAIKEARSRNHYDVEADLIEMQKYLDITQFVSHLKEQSITDSLTYDEFASRYNRFSNRPKKRTVDFKSTIKDESSRFINAMIYSTKQLEEVELLYTERKNDTTIYVVKTKEGIICEAIYNVFTNTYYADDKYAKRS